MPSATLTRGEHSRAEKTPAETGQTMETSKYEAFSDEELIGLLREGDGAVMDYLMDKYKNMVRAKAQSMFLLGGDTEDLIQEGMIGLFRAVQEYDFGRDASFRTFAELCVSRKMYNAIERFKGQKHMPLNNYVSTSEEEGADAGEALAGQLARGDFDPEELLIKRENLEQLRQAMAETLSDFELRAFELHLTGAGSGEVAKILGKSPKATDNAIQRARHKLQNMNPEKIFSKKS